MLISCSCSCSFKDLAHALLTRLQSEVETCRVQQPFQIVVERNPQDRLTTAMEQVRAILFQICHIFSFIN